MILLGACAGWSLITAAAHDGRPEGRVVRVVHGVREPGQATSVTATPAANSSIRPRW
ncbi:hypothetical protein SCANM63S_04473 [Streptomyces canarius]